MADAFEIQELRKGWNGRRILEIERAAFPAGEVTAVVGANGCGKTTLLECLNGLIPPESGTVRFFGEPLKQEERRRMTLVFQSPYLFHGTVADNVNYGLRVRRSRDRAAVAEALRAVGLEGFERRNARQLSGGEAKRVAIARALAIHPEALLMDEPTGDVDAESTTKIEDAIRKLCSEKGATVILATHSRSQAVRLAHRTLMLSDGNLVPYHPDNHFQAELREENREKLLLFANGLRAFAVTSRPPGPVSCVISPEDIIVSALPFDSSARNRWSGPVTAIVLQNDRVRITVDPGMPVVAAITRASYESIHPAIGETVHLTFKASSAKVFGA